ncbi:fibronectin type III domain-containing protein [Streptomyces vinaceus]|uniref:fibronectin type III domain-containing protein n=1 Tax=Streptomyces vinaceus TaxID=1960 RepID=UPI0037F159C1
MAFGAITIPMAASASAAAGDVSVASCKIADGATQWWASGEVNLANHGRSEAKDWKLQFDVSEGQVTIDNPWAFALVQKGDHVTVTSVEARGGIPAGGQQTVKVGINPGGAAVPKISNCTVDGSDGKPDDAPSAPENNGSFVIDHTKVHLMWKPATSSGSAVSAYEIYENGERFKEVSGSTTMTDLEKLTPDTAYTFKIRAISETGKASAFSHDISLRTKAEPLPDKPAPVPPTSLGAKSNGPHQVDLAWEAGEGADGISGYRVYREGTKVQEVSGSTTRWTVSGLTPDTEYRFKVTAVNALGKESEPTEEVSVRTAKNEDGADKDHAPGDLKVSSLSKKNGGIKEYYLNLGWAVPEGQGTISTYQVYLDGKPAQTFMWGTDSPTVPIPSGRASREVLVGTEEGQSFRVKIRAKLGDGSWSGFSEEKQVTTAD